jgi:NAD(P)-dependent dehydrogenase (short-subunit alcohol dehydrogenase family)
MELQDRTIVVTGGGSGIGRAMVERFAKDNPGGITVVDRDGEAARMVADAVNGLAITADLSRESEVLRVIAQTEAQYGPIDRGDVALRVGAYPACSRARRCWWPGCAWVVAVLDRVFAHAAPPLA